MQTYKSLLKVLVLSTPTEYNNQKFFLKIPVPEVIGLVQNFSFFLKCRLSATRKPPGKFGPFMIDSKS